MHEKISVNSVCLSGGSSSWPEVVSYWRALHPRRVSFIGPQIEDATAVRDLIKSDSYTLETIFHPFLIGKQLESKESTWIDEREKLTRAIKFASSVGARSVYIPTGGHGTLTWEEAAQAFSAAIAPCVAEAKSAGLILMIENTGQLYANIHIAHSLRDALTLAEMAGVGICIDLFACWSEAGLHETIRRAIPRCDLIQVADYVYGDRSLPCRAVPGDGAIPLKRVFDWALSAGFKGAFDLELLGPRIEKEGYVAATRRAADNVGELLHSLGA